LINDIYLEKISAPSNKCCVDLNGDGKITPSDAQVFYEIMSGNRTKTYCTYYPVVCYSGATIGDANGDSIVSSADANIIFDIYLGKTPKPAYLCCVDVNGDGQVTSVDSQAVYDIISGAKAKTYCPNICTDSDTVEIILNGAGDEKTFYSVQKITIKLNGWDSAGTKAYLSINGNAYTWSEGNTYSAYGIYFYVSSVDVSYIGNDATATVKIIGDYKNYYKKGQIVGPIGPGEGSGGWDYCYTPQSDGSGQIGTTGTNLLEWYCTSGYGAGQDIIKCPTGCENEACKPYTCDQLKKDRSTYFDSCGTSGFDKICFNKYTGLYQGCGKSTDAYDYCTDKNDNAAQNILCKVDSYCTDSDGGKDYNVKGTITGLDGNGVISTDTDFCRDSNVLVEWFCSGVYRTNTNYQCPNGCKDGACIQKNQTCIDSDGGKDYYVKGYVTYEGYVLNGELIKEYDTCVGNVLQEKYCPETGIGTIDYSCPNGCKDGACVKQMNITCYDSDNSPDYLIMPPNDVLDMSKNPAFFTKGYGRGIYVGSTENLIFGQEPDPNTPKPTTDPYSTYYDYCFDYKQLNEAFCMSDGRLGAHSINCPNGCKDGTCVKQVQTCTDSDGGKNYYVKGNVISADHPSSYDTCRNVYKNAGGSLQSDPVESCTGSNCYVQELYCLSNNNLGYEEVPCPNGCKDGACISIDYVKEQVKCVFDVATEDNKCYSDAGFNCYGMGSCVADVYGSKGQQLTWKSSCGGYAYTIIDGQNEYANFYCKPSSYCGNGICELGETQQSCPQDCIKNCPAAIDIIFNKQTYYPDDYLEATIKLYDQNKNLIPNHAFNMYYIYSGKEYPTSTMYTDSTGVYKSSSKIPPNFNYYGEFIFVVSSTDEGCNYVSDKEKIYINALDKCGDAYCDENEKEMLCTATCNACPVTASVASGGASSITGAITAETTTNVPACQYLWWFDNTDKTCGYKKFCGAYMYYGLQTFESAEACKAALNWTNGTIPTTETCGCKEYCTVKCPRDCTPKCGNGICDSITCQAAGCPLAENERNCPQDCAAISYCGSQSQDSNCICKEGFTKEKFEAPCSAITETASSTTNICTYYRCIPSFTYLNLQTNKYSYDISEQVTISTNSFEKEKLNLQELPVAVKDPYGNPQNIILKPECNTADVCPSCVSGGYCPSCKTFTTCQFKGVYSSTKAVGLYSVESAYTGDNPRVSPTSFRVFDYSLLKKYLILSEIDGYKYSDSNLLEGPEKIAVYVAKYQKGDRYYDAMIGDFGSRDILDAFLSQLFKYNPPSEEKFDGQYIYVLKSGNQKVYFWTHDTFLVIVSEEVYAQMSSAVKSFISAESTKIATALSSSGVDAAINEAVAAVSGGSGGFFTGMITGMPVAGGSQIENKNCGADSAYSECVCINGETKESFQPPCTGDVCGTHYRCKPSDPTELIKAYLDKYPSDIKAIGTECETKSGYCISSQDSCKDGFEESSLTCKTTSDKCCVKEVNKEDFLEIVLKLESIRVKMDKFEAKAKALADYYNSTGDTERATKFQEAAGMFSTAKAKIDSIIANIKNNIDDLEKIRDEIKADMKSLRSYITKILEKMVS
jgi:hypothetical protein